VKSRNGQRGMSTVGTLLLLGTVGAFAWLGSRYYPSLVGAFTARSALYEAASRCLSGGASDRQCRWDFDDLMKAAGLERPRSDEVKWERKGSEAIEIGFDYTDPIDLGIYKTSMRHTWSCRATTHGCIND